MAGRKHPSIDLRHVVCYLPIYSLEVLLDRKIAISMEGRGRALDNVFIERLWWSLKYEDVYPRVYGDGSTLY